MKQYLLATYAGGEPADAPAAPPSPEAMQAMMEGIIAIEAELEEAGRFVFGGRLDGPDAATVLRPGDSDVSMTDGPFVESKEHIAGFYIINAEDLDDALAWAGKVSKAINNPIEVRPFGATGKAADHMPG
jgi:hypothetical protein